MELSIALKDLYRAIGELAYVIARTDNQTNNLERKVFQEAIKEELGKENWVAGDRFDMLYQQSAKIDAEKTYNHAIYLMKIHQAILSEDLIDKFINVLEKVGGVSGISDDERILIERFIDDSSKILNK